MVRLIRPCLPTSEDLLRSLTEHSLTQLNTLTMAPHRYSHPHWQGGVKRLSRNPFSLSLMAPRSSTLVL